MGPQKKILPRASRLLSAALTRSASTDFGLFDKLAYKLWDFYAGMFYSYVVSMIYLTIV